LTWYLRSGSGAGAPAAGAPAAGPPSAGQFAFGSTGWLAVAGDWQGTGHTGIGAFDPASGTWYLRSTVSAGAPDAGTFPFGGAGWKPLTGDWHNSGHTGVGAYDPATATWYLRNEDSAGAPDAGAFAFGVAGGIPVVGDWTGTGHLGVGVFDPATATWYLRSSLSAGAPDAGVFQFGGAGWAAAAGPVAGHGRAGIGVIDPGTGTWYLRSSATPGAPDAGQVMAGPGWLPVAGAFPPQAQFLLAAGGEGPGPVAAFGTDPLRAAVAAEVARLSAAGVSPALADQAVAYDGGSSQYWAQRNPDNEAFLDQGGQARVLFLGDSVTDWLANGAGRPVWDNSFAPLGAADFAVAGIGTAQVLWQVEQGQVARAGPHVVVLLIGSNDLYFGQSPQQVAAATAKIIGEIRGQLPDTRVLLLGVLPRGQGPADPLRGPIAQLNGLLAHLDDGDAVRFLDIGGSFVRRDGTISPLVMPDFLHPSLLGYQLYANDILGTLRQMLGES
jgi:lysophospholipase L1-like esterase